VWNGDIKPGPLEIGFDYAFIMPATGDRVPTVYMENHRIVDLDPADPIQVNYKQKIGNEPTGAENPELLRLKHTHGHDMTIVNGVGRIGWMSGGRSAWWKDEDMADTYARKAIAFIERSTSESKGAPFFLYLATHGIHVPRVPNARFQGTSQAGTRGDAIQELDDTVRQVLETLDRLKLAENTLVIFTSDNGGVNDDGYEDFGPPEHALNGALRGTKGTVYEGGHRVPFIARWPGKIKPGTESAALIAHLDMPATFAALTGVPLPADAAPDSFNVLPALLGQSRTARESAIFHNGGTQGPLALRMGSWKFIQPGGSAYGKANAKQNAKAAPLKPQLYNLADDLAETKDLAAEMPEKVKEFSDFLAQARKSGRTRP
jgi:arylsulfatase A-like enzyme